jgi:hypothetical protein
MPEQGQLPGFGVPARRSADRLALALEEVGFDVGRAFPMLGAGVDARGRPGVELGRVAVTVADRLSAVLTEAVRHGVTAPAGDDWPDAARHDPDAGN